MAISKHLGTIFFFLLCCALSTAAGAADSDSAAKDHHSNLYDQIQINDQTKSSKPLPAQIQVVGVELSNVRDLLVDLKRARTAVNNLYEEMSRHPVSVNNVANAIGSVVTTIPQPTMNTGETLEARKQWVDMYNAQITPIVTYMKKDLEEVRGGEKQLSLPTKLEADLQIQLKNWGDDVDKAFETTTKLSELTQSEPYRSGLIVSQLSELQKTLGSMEKTGKNVIRLLKKSR